MLWTVVAAMASMFWFPVPAAPDPRAAEFPEVERQWITGPLTLAQVVLAVLIPVWFVALAAWAAAALIMCRNDARGGLEVLRGRG